MNVLLLASSLLAGYLLGSVSWGYFVGKLRGVDVRQVGSGSTGMTNVLRTLGPTLALVVLAGDIAKGVLAVLLARWLTGGSPVAEALAATLAVVGHNWPVFSGFRGGRGIATGVGGLTTLSPLSGAIATGVFLAPVALTRYVSLGSILAVFSAMVTIPIFVALGWTPVWYIAYVALGGPMIIWQHRGNIQRLVKGTERKLGEQTPVQPSVRTHRQDPQTGGSQ
ncbi:MAG: glycerol-3-phosphate 1-O-acyltransferase PlsY [Chloroflexi bacterium]|nr:glycerol-3-phosphate 1-O-acyltransferase PlsY [Chloroflexota bacterium]